MIEGNVLLPHGVRHGGGDGGGEADPFDFE